ncbi:FMN-dependent NADH-azoreductase [Falsihalocynthiibacter arcticus]|uniref:FMN dependent NADH:quinone oxidoreductase n=1 Tax=Falsihalocynthiibacter arcticus TaxID=1579316 RepID=A0A126UWQ7_9RHOB|nr:NAD(P)H-dependent oxidoreductase [Falsihalocynthiibacter arcticus]AML50512.1 FMN-dependent NADH-azoreductase [Falsihalocynthiibacter arcticus]
MTHNILRIDASARYQGSISRDLGDDFIDQKPNATVTTRDLAQGIPQINETWVGATFTPPEARTTAQKATLALSDELVAELIAADEIVLTTPLYNFSAPAAFKAWVDQIARAGVTFKYTETGPVGLLDDKPVTIIVSSGGVALGSPVDFFSAHARQVFNFIGITNVTLVGASGGTEAAITTAKTELTKIAA